MDLLELQNAVDKDHSVDVLSIATGLLGPSCLDRTGLEGHESYVAPSIELFTSMRVASDDGFVEAERDVRSVDGRGAFRRILYPLIGVLICCFVEQR